MKKTILLLFLCLLLCFCGCAPQQGDFFAPFAAGCRAQLRGTLHGVAFEGELELSHPTSTGERTATFTFYAPQTLKGTTITRDGEGKILLCNGMVRIEGAAGFTLLLDAFAHGGEITEVTLQGERTRVVSADFAMEFLSDGTPARIERGALCAEVLSFEVTE